MALIAKIDYSDTYVSGTEIVGQVFIALYDATNGQLTNGNNVVVTYIQNINGTTMNGSVTIAGQSAPIYTGLISNSDPSHPYYTQWTITGISAAPPPSPPVNICDLAINYIAINDPESAPGAADGQITINATSSYPPVQYSLDNVNFQSSPIFSGLTDGLKTVYVKDANGCVNYNAITVPVLNNLLISDPSVTLTGGNISRWSAAFNPVVFTYQRKDFEVSAVSLDTVSGNASVTVNCDVTAVLQTVASNAAALANAANQGVVLTNITPAYIYINAGSYVGTFQVTGGQSNSLIINTPYTANATGFINIDILRPYYQVRTQITYQDPYSGQQNTITSTNRPDATGLVKADISNFLQSLLQAKDSNHYTQINYRDLNLSASYQIAYAEYWDGKLAGSQTLTYVSVSNPYYIVYAAKQLGDNYGGNLAAYVPFQSVTNPEQMAKWITDFMEPAYSNGYPFDIGFIYSENLTGLQLYCQLELLDINRDPLPGGPQNSYLLNEDSSWLLNQDSSKFIIAAQPASTIPLPAQLGLNRLLISDAFESDAYYFNLTLMYNDDNGNPVAVTQTQTVRIDDTVDEQSVYLRWIGLTGSWNYYRFVYNQEITLDVQNAVIIKNFVSDWANQDGIEEVIGKSAGQKMKVMAEDLSVADIKGLQSIKYSPKVQMLMGKNPMKWQTVVINTATFTEYETLNGQAPFSIMFNLPSINIQTQ